MPNTEEPIIEEWIKYMHEIVGAPDENTYFIGHSIGCQAIMRYLQTVEQKVGGTVFIAGWFVLYNLDEEEIKIAKPWIETPIDFEKVKSVSKKHSLIISDNDPFGGFEGNIENFKKLNVKINILSDAGHIEDAELPIALEEILRISK